jgi:hypothetical protein
LKAELTADASTAPWVTEDALFRNYKLLQFFDTFALFLQCDPPGNRGSSQFPNVPQRVGDDVTISATETDASTVTVTPWPFAGESLTVATSGRIMTPAQAGTDLVSVFDETPVTQQEVTLVGG